MEELNGKLAKNLYRSSVEVVMDDEKYFTLLGHKVPGNAGYYSSDRSKCPDKVRFAGKEKYPTKVLIRPSKSEAIDSDIYINEYLTKRLLSFIHENHPDLNYIFWPDLAQAHYSKATVAWMDQNVNYVPKPLNPPNVAQACPIENFLGWLTQKVYEEGWEATSDQQLVRRIQPKIKEIGLKSVEKLMTGVKAKLKSIADDGVFYYLKN